MTVDVVEVLVEAAPVLVEVPAPVVEVVEVLTPGPPGPPGSAVPSASGTVTVPAVVWVMQHNLHYRPAGWSFVDEAGDPLEPIRIVHVNDNVATAEWLSPGVSGSWSAS